MHARSRARKSWLAGLMVGLLIVSQISVAAQACMLAGMAGSPAAVMSQEGCDGAPMDGRPCRLYCLMQDQSAASPDQHLLAVPASTSAEHAAIALPAMRVSVLSSAAVLRAGPPLRILYCSYLT